MEEQTAYIKFDIIAIKQYQEDLLCTIQFIKDELPDVNWNSQVETRQYFADRFDIILHSQTISGLKELVETTNEEEYIEYPEEAIELLTGLIELKKLQSEDRNYLQNILKHEQKGKVLLRYADNNYVMQNKRPLPYSKAIVECIVSCSSEVVDYAQRMQKEHGINIEIEW